MRVRLRNPDRELTIDGASTVRQLLRELDIDPQTVLVLRGGELVAADTALADTDSIEVRPVISGGAGSPRCRACAAPAVIEEPRHRAAWCGEHFIDHVHAQIRKAIGRYRMLSYADRLLVAVSGGKDSLGLWDALLAMGYRADGLYIGLGIGGYSQRSVRPCRVFAAAHGANLLEVDLATEYGYRIPQAAQAARRATCGICGLSKRYVINREAVRGGYDVVVTGHNLDDEAATLLGNVVRWQEGFLARQRPLLPATGKNQPRKAKPLYRLSEREMAAYCVVRGIDYVVEECPLVSGNTGLELKEAFNVLERHSPGLKAQFLLGFLDKQADKFADLGDGEGAGVALGDCASCGMPTTSDTCAFCRQRERILAVAEQTCTQDGESGPVPSPRDGPKARAGGPDHDDVPEPGGAGVSPAGAGGAGVSAAEPGLHPDLKTA
ncbi:MAG: MoaD/ThiS family protein [Actinomycetota bacterium]|nr:MoaD/ThiS family protein [Actinomycetota bacterium]